MEFIQPADLPPASGPSSYMVKCDGWVYISGILPKNAAGEVTGRGDLAAQAEQVLANLQSAMAAAGGSLRDVVDLLILIRQDVASRYNPDVTGARIRFFGDHRPAGTVARVVSIGHPDALLEIKAVGYVAS